MLEIKLIKSKNINEILVVNNIFNYDSRYDSKITFLDELCEKLQDEKCCEFLFQFENENFTMDVETDLSLFLEDFDKGFKVFNYEFGTFDIQFVEYGAGVLFFIFEVDDEQTYIHWEIHQQKNIEKSEKITMQTKDVIKMFEDVRDTFYELASHIYPSITNHPAFKEWYKKLFIEYYD